MTLPHEHQLPADCYEALSQVNQYIDGELAPELCQEIERHLANCPNCQIVFDTLTQTIKLYQVLEREPVELPAGLEERLLQRLITLKRSPDAKSS